MLHNTVGASPRGSVTIPASTELNAATQVISGYDSQNASEAKPRNAPFIPEPFITGKSVSWIKLNVITAGTLTVGCYKISDIVPYDEEVAGSYNSLRTLTVSTTGEQTLTLSPSVYIPSGYALAICTTADTCTFAYGNYGTTMSYYWFENTQPRVVRQTASKSLGLDIGCVEVAFTEDTMNGQISVSVSDSETISPSVTAGYVDSVANGSAFVSTSSTYQLATQAATTITPSGTAQTAIAAGTYATGAATVEAIVCENLTAANILSGVTVKVGTATDDDSVVSVTGTASSSGIAYDTGTFTFASDTVATTNLFQAHNLGVKPGFIVVWTDDYAGIDSESPVDMGTMIGGVFLDGLGGIELQKASSSASSSNPVHSIFTIGSGDYRISPFAPTSSAYGFFTADNSSTQFKLPKISGTYWRTGVAYHYLVAEAWWS